MEEWVGQWWHRAVVQLADRRHPQAAVRLDEVRAQLGVVFRALGAPPAWRLATAAPRRHGGPRGWLQRLAGSGDRAALPTLDAETLALPSEVAVFADTALNRALYLWLAAQAAECLSLCRHEPSLAQDWIGLNRTATARVLAALPGWRDRHQRLLTAILAQRPDPFSLRGRAAEAERLVQRALGSPDWPASLVPSRLPVQANEVLPVPIWIDAACLQATAAATPVAAREARTSSDRPLAPDGEDRDDTRRRARQMAVQPDRHGLMMFFRTESLLSWSEFVRVSRQTEDEPTPDAAQVANDMESLTVDSGGSTLASRVRFDLDLPSAASDDIVLAADLRLPEWDYRRGVLEADRCAVQLLQPRHAETWSPPAQLKALASRMGRRLETLTARPAWQGGHESGEHLDLDAWVRWRTDAPGDEPRIHLRRHRRDRSLSVLLMADLSQSTDAWVGNDARVIDVTRDALYVFGQAMHRLGDPFEVLGFSSVKRHHVRIHQLKAFGETWCPAVQNRIGAIRPGYYTRMGAAIRHATRQLAARGETHRLLLLLTDGKPNDLDHYEGRFGLEDTRQAVREARAQGLLPFCITIDRQAPAYLPHLFGAQGHAVIHRPTELVTRLTQLVGQLMARTA
ncbi:VWA domain-containing protein [uncultured Aquabacterium sp.]|jgi:nitric oxide reductase NorD protein|uniref:nitric oxide reductase activation protein NorD n=1 Tax=uncultured Aquabacterium sp. TaxID=158753 RepID=UPI0026340977|nr:VWA domain-containing protein [uncultured Aquabacterium sp.]